MWHEWFNWVCVSTHSYVNMCTERECCCWPLPFARLHFLLGKLFPLPWRWWNNLAAEWSWERASISGHGPSADLWVLLFGSCKKSSSFILSRPNNSFAQLSLSLSLCYFSKHVTRAQRHKHTFAFERVEEGPACFNSFYFCHGFFFSFRWILKKER